MKPDRILFFGIAFYAAVLYSLIAYSAIGANTVVVMVSILYLSLLILGGIYWYDNLGTQYMAVNALLVIGVIGEYLSFHELEVSKYLKYGGFAGSLIVSVLLVAKGWQYKQKLGIDMFTFFITSACIWAQIIIYELYPSSFHMMAKTINYALVALLATLILKSSYRTLVNTKELNLLRYLLMISLLPVIDNFFQDFANQFY